MLLQVQTRSFSGSCTMKKKKQQRKLGPNLRDSPSTQHSHWYSARPSMLLLFHPCWGKAVFFKCQPAFQKLNFYGSLSTALLVPATKLPCIQLLALCLSRSKYLMLHAMKGTESPTSSPVLGRDREQFCLTLHRQQVCDKKYRAITLSRVCLGC